MKFIITLITLFSTFFMGKITAQSEAEMKAWQDYMTPGEVHKMMAQADGEWDEDISMYMDPAAPPTKSTATSKTEMILGGRYQQSKTTGNMMGMPFEGISLLGYDNAKKMFTMIWVDNFGTGTITMEGNWDAASKSIILKGKGTDPVTGKDIGMRQVIKFVDNDTQLIEMYDTKNGKETKSMEIISKRKK